MFIQVDDKYIREWSCACMLLFGFCLVESRGLPLKRPRAVFIRRFSIFLTFSTAFVYVFPDLDLEEDFW